MFWKFAGLVFAVDQVSIHSHVEDSTAPLNHFNFDAL